MYLKGYQLECTIKARLMLKFRVKTLMDLETRLSKKHKKQVEITGKSGHNLQYLVKLSGQGNALSNNKSFKSCKEWTVDWRYDPADGTEKETEDFFQAADEFLAAIENNI